MNMQSQVLQQHEIKAITADPEVRQAIPHCVCV
jgi:hypothetical protein